MYKTTAGELNKYLRRINTSQKSVLEAAFANNYFPNKTMLIHVAEQTGLAENVIRHWFRNKRYLTRCERKEGKISINKEKGNDKMSTVNITYVYISTKPLFQNIASCRLYACF